MTYEENADAGNFENNASVNENFKANIGLVCEQKSEGRVFKFIAKSPEGKNR